MPPLHEAINYFRSLDEGLLSPAFRRAKHAAGAYKHSREHGHGPVQAAGHALSTAAASWHRMPKVASATRREYKAKK